MNRLAIVFLNLILIIIGFFIIYFSPLSALAITIGMLFIAISIISFAILIYFPPSQPGYVKLRVVEENPKIPKRVMRKRPKKRTKRKKR
jgi:hypothetical protein